MSPFHARRRALWGRPLPIVVLAALVVLIPAVAQALPTSPPAPFQRLALPSGSTVDGDSSSVTLGVRFTASTDGFVTGVEFRRDSTSNTAREVQFWDATTKAELATSSRIPLGTGMVHQWFDNPVAVTAGHEYVASYLAPAGRYNALNNAHAAAQTSGSLTAPVNAGVYAYGAAATFPASAYQSSDYQVTPVFVAKVNGASPFQKLAASTGGHTDSDTRSTTLGVKFTPQAEGYVTGVEYNRINTTVGQSVQLWDTSTGTQLGSSSRTPLGTGVVHQWFDEPVAVHTGHTYVASYYAPAGKYYSADGYWAQAHNAGQLGAGVSAGVYGYGSSATYPNSVYQNEDYGVTPVFVADPSTTATPAPPADQPPTASFTATTSGLTASVDGSTSSDPDGTVASYSWNWGDTTATGSGATAAHAYAAAGSYTVTLTVTDNSGATATTSKSISVTSPGGTTTGWFTSNAAGQILDPNGKVFVPVGVNANGPDWVWNGPTIGESGQMAAWHFNTLRLNACMTQCDPTWVWHTNDNLDGIVNEYTAKHDVVIISQHQCGADYGHSGCDQQLMDWWKATAAKYAQNPYVWFNLLNEPTTNAGSGAVTDLAEWDRISRELAQVVRSVAPNNMIVADGNAFGQDKGTWTCDPTSQINGVDYAGSAIINKGPAFKRDFGNVLFSVHVYGEWGGNESSGCTTNAWDAALSNYVDKVHSLGLPLMAGEMGSVQNKANETFGEAGSWNAGQSVFRVLPGKGVGVLGWHGDGGCGFALFDPPANWTNGPSSAKLGWEGQGLLTYAQTVNP